jgi:hypothetical protein
MQTKQVTLNLDEVRKNKFFVATPCYGGQLTEPYFRSVVKLMTFFNQHRIPLAFGTIANESLVTRARNVLVAYFLNSDYTHLMFVDADIEFQVEDMLKLFVHNKDIAVGAYPKKGVNWSHIKEGILMDPSRQHTNQQIGALGSDYAINFKFSNRETKTVAVENGLIKLHDAGTGFMMIKRETILKMIEKYPELKYNNDVQMGGVDLKDNFYALFDTMIDPIDKRYLSEDYTFCRRWQAMDGDIWLDPSISLNHYGSFCFQGNPEMIIQFNNDVPLTTKKVQAAEATNVEEEWEEIDIENL